MTQNSFLFLEGKQTGLCQVIEINSVIKTLIVYFFSVFSSNSRIKFQF